jgi:hypothetical protein
MKPAHIFGAVTHNNFVEDILTPVRDRAVRWMFVLCIVSAFLAIFFFVAYENINKHGGATTVPLVGGIISTIIALIFGTLSFVRFLRKRSIVTGLFITTTVATLVYSITSRVIAAKAATSATPYNTAIMPLATGTSNSAAPNIWGAITLAQIGLFAVWFLFILFTIYVYIRPIRKIDALLTQILDGKEIRKARVGKSVQYKDIEDKLKMLADEKYKREIQRANRLSKSRERSAKQRELMQELLAEKEKLSPTTEIPPVQ